MQSRASGVPSAWFPRVAFAAPGSCAHCAQCISHNWYHSPCARLHRSAPYAKSDQNRRGIELDMSPMRTPAIDRATVGLNRAASKLAESNQLLLSAYTGAGTRIQISCHASSMLAVPSIVHANTNRLSLSACSPVQQTFLRRSPLAIQLPYSKPAMLQAAIVDMSRPAILYSMDLP